MLEDVFWALVVAAAAAAGVFFALRTPERMRDQAGQGEGRDPPPLLELEECDRCGRKVADLAYHRRRCLGRPKRFRYSENVKAFRPRARRDKT